MIRYIFVIKIFSILVLLSSIANSLPFSSTYLIINEAILLNDYETAAKYFSNDQFLELSIIEEKKKLISFVNANKFEQAANVADQLINFGINDEDFWIVYLTDAKLKNNLKVFNKFESLNGRFKTLDKFEKIKYAFYLDTKINQNNHSIALALFDIVQNSIQQNSNQNENIRYFLFFLNLILNLSPEFNEAIFLKAQFFQHLNYHDKAESMYNAIQSNHPLYLEAQKNIAINKKNAGKFNEAEELLTSLINSNPNNHSLNKLLADLYRTSNFYRKAIQYYTELLKIKNINTIHVENIFYMRGICYERLGIWEKAERDFLQSLKINSEQPQVLNYLAYGWIERNVKIDESIEMLQLAITKNPKSHYILDSLAWAYYKKNNLTKAVNMMEKVIKIAPAEAISLDHLGDIYFQLGRKREAYFMWTQARDLSEPEDEIIDSVQLKLDRYNEG